MNQMVEYTVWNTTTREVYSVGNCLGEKECPEGHAVHYGEKVPWETHVFGEDDLPVERTSPRLLDADEFSANVNRERQRRIETGKDFDGIWLTGSDKDQANLMGLGRKAEKLTAAGVTAPVIPFRDGLNVIHWLTPEQMTDLEDQGAYYVSLCYQASWAIKEMSPLTDYTDDNLWP